MKSAREKETRNQTRRAVVLSGILFLFVLWFIQGAFSSGSYLVCSRGQSIYTLDEAKPAVQCLSVKGTRIYDTGSYNEIQLRHLAAITFPGLTRFAPTFALNALSRLVALLTQRPVKYIDRDSIIIPGLADAHAHIMDYGWMAQLPLGGADSVQDVVDRIKSFLEAHPDVLANKTVWVEGMGWDQTRWPGGSFPTAADLDNDPMLRGRPISLSRVDGHARWVSPRVLELMSRDGEIPDVAGGLILRDEKGKPTGIFLDNAMQLIPTPPWTDTQLEAYFTHTVKEALSYGLTTIHDAMASPETIQFLKKKAEKGDIPIRLNLMGHLPSAEYWGTLIPRLNNHGPQERLTVRSIKIIADGALGSWGASMLKPYSDRPEESGLLLIPEDKLKNLVNKFHNDGWQVNVHCIGDRANHAVLDILEEILLGGANVTSWRPRIEHAQILAPTDIPRMQRLGVIASVQPTHATSDMHYAEKRIGPERIKGAYAYQTLLRASPVGVLPLGSDFPVEGVNPLLGFYAAVSRLSPGGWSPHGPGGWYPGERLTRAQALKGMTLDAAYASFMEHDVGSLVPGKKADFVVLDKNIMSADFAEILETKVKATVIDAEVVYGDL